MLYSFSQGATQCFRGLTKSGVKYLRKNISMRQGFFDNFAIKGKKDNSEITVINSNQG
jgi:hypothetical protein